MMNSGKLVEDIDDIAIADEVHVKELNKVHTGILINKVRSAIH